MKIVLYLSINGMLLSCGKSKTVATSAKACINTTTGFNLALKRLMIEVCSQNVASSINEKIPNI